MAQGTATTRVVKLVIDSSQFKKESDKINKNLNNISKSAKKASGAMSRLATIGGALFAANLIRNTAQFGIELALSAEKIDLLSKKMLTLTKDVDALDKVVASANAVGVAFTELGSVVGRFAVATQNAFPVDQMLKWTEGIVKSGRLVGNTQKEINSGLIQLSQGLSAGALMGDEFRSVMENLPLLAMEIRKEFEGSTISLKELSSQGEITAEVTVRAMENLADSMKGIPGLTDTISAQLERLGNSWDMMLNAMMGSTDNWVTHTIDGISGMIEDVVELFDAVAANSLYDAMAEVEEYDKKLSALQAKQDTYKTYSIDYMSVAEDITELSRAYEKSLSVVDKYNAKKKEEIKLKKQLEAITEERRLGAEFTANNKLEASIGKVNAARDASIGIIAKYDSIRANLIEQSKAEGISDENLAKFVMALVDTYKLQGEEIDKLNSKKTTRRKKR